MAKVLKGVRKLTGGDVGQVIAQTNQVKIGQAQQAASSIDLSAIKGTTASLPSSIVKHDEMIAGRAQKAADAYGKYLSPDKRARQNVHAARQSSRKTKEQWEAQQPSLEAHRASVQNDRMLDQAHRMNKNFDAGRARVKGREDFITDVRDRLQGSSISRETVEASYNKVSKQDGWHQMSKNDRRQAVMNDGMDTTAYNMAHSRMSPERVRELSANGTLHTELAAQAPMYRKQMEQNIAARRGGSQAPGTPIGTNTGGSANGQRRSKNSAQQQAINNNAALFSKDDIPLDGVGRGGQYAVDRAIANSKFAENNFDSIANDGVKNKVMRDFRMDDDEFAAFQGLDQSQRKEFYMSKAKEHAANPGAMNQMIGNKVPQIAVGGLATAGLVSAMSNSRGQQSNSQLYGQQQPYY